MNKKVNVLITGTPGTGKSLLTSKLQDHYKNKFNYIHVNKLISENKLFSEYDDELDCTIFNKEKTLNKLVPLLLKKSNIVNFHSSDFLPKELFNLVIVLTTDNEVLFDRLQKRGYNSTKIQENVTAEIMQVVVEEARNTFSASKLLLFKNDDLCDLKVNIDKIILKIDCLVSGGKFID